MFEFCPPSELRDQKIFGLEPEKFDYSLLNPSRSKKIK